MQRNWGPEANHFWANKSFSQVVASHSISNKGAQSQPDFLENTELKMHIDLKKINV